MKISEHANYLLNEYGRLQFDYAAYCKPYGESLRNEARNNLEEYIAELEAENDRLQNELIIVHEKAMEDTSAALFWYAKAKGISLEHTSIKSNTIAWMQKRIAELEAERIKTGLHIKSLEGWIETMDKKFATLEAERRWISVTERLPEVKSE